MTRGPVALVIPGRSTRAATIESRRIAAAGLARALGRPLGGVEVLELTDDASDRDPVRSVAEPSPARAVARALPGPIRALMGDVAELRAGIALRRCARERIGRRPSLVLQFHRRFNDAGAVLARRYGVPFVLRVEGLDVREHAGWGVRRPLAGPLVERLGERPVFDRADLLLPVSEAVDGWLASVGIAAARRLVVPNGIDLEAFAPGPADRSLRDLRGWGDRFVVGWVGGFRPFHGLGLIAETACRLRARVPGATICLVGTGPLRARALAAAGASGGALEVAGPIPHEDVPRWLRTFDACVALADDGPFHYSPLKVLEYLACGRPSVIADVGDHARALRSADAAVVVPAADPAAAADALGRIATDADLAAGLATRAREGAASLGSWDVQARRVLDRLEMDASPVEVTARG